MTKEFNALPLLLTVRKCRGGFVVIDADGDLVEVAKRPIDLGRSVQQLAKRDAAPKVHDPEDVAF